MHINGYGKIMPGKKLEVKAADGTINIFEAQHIILATGARSRELPSLKQDGKKINNCCSFLKKKIVF